MKFCLEVKGDLACFTRPEMKVERVSYDVITPSAARAIFEAILWKPAIRWQVTRIEVLKPIQRTNIRRNEVSSVISTKNVKRAMNGDGRPLQIFIEEDRQQRAGLLLRDVAYRLYARLNLQDDSKHKHRYPHLRCEDTGNNENSYAKFAEMFKRRARKGQCFHQPYLGNREFPASWRLVESLSGEPKAIQIEHNQPLGWMLYDLDYSNPNDPSPLFYNPTLTTDGSITVPAPDSEEVCA